jgi:hypothetical protein
MPFNVVFGRLLHCDETSRERLARWLPAALFKGIVGMPENLALAD